MIHGTGSKGASPGIANRPLKRSCEPVELSAALKGIIEDALATSSQADLSLQTTVIFAAVLAAFVPLALVLAAVRILVFLLRVGAGPGGGTRGMEFFSASCSGLDARFT